MLSRGSGGIEQAFINLVHLIHHHTTYDQLAVMDNQTKIILDQSVKQKRIRQVADWDPVGLYRLFRIIQSYQPDIIVCHGNRPLKMVQTIGKISSTPEKIVGFCHNYSIRHLIKADAVIAVSKHMIDDYLIPGGMSSDKCFHLPNMIDLSAVKPKPFRGMPKIPVLGTMGRFVPKKGFSDFIQALSILKNQGVILKVKIGGTGPENDNLRKLVQQNGLTTDVEFIGWVKNKREFYDQIDIFCLPSREEPFGIIALDTLAHGNLMIATKTKGPMEFLINDETAILCEANNPKDIAVSIQKALNLSENSHQKMRQSGLDLVRQYDIKVISEKFNQIINQIISSI